MNSLAVPFRRRKTQIIRVFTLTLVFSVCASTPMAGSLNSNGLDWFSMLQGLLFGLVVFLFGMGMMGEAMRSTVGDQMKTMLQRLTDLVARLRSSANFARKIAKAVLGTFSDQDIDTARLVKNTS